MGKNPLTDKVIGCAIEVHRILGPGLLESRSPIVDIHETCRDADGLVDKF